MPGRENAQGREHAIGHPAVTDSLTGLANGLHFDLVYSYLFTGGNRGVSFSVMLISVGAKPSDADIRSLGDKIERTTRDSDLVAHLGGGRFVVLLLGTNLPGARVAADRLETALSGSEQSVSVGLAVYSADMRSPSELLETADKALLAAEAAGGGIEFG